MKRREATLAEQKMCSEQAAKVAQERGSGDAQQHVTHLYTGHYDAKSNVCYVMSLYLHADEKGDPKGKFILVVDAFEGRMYARFLETPVGQVQFCNVTPPDRTRSDSSDTFDSEQEFRALAFKLYGIAQYEQGKMDTEVP